MINATEAEERAHLEIVKHKLGQALDEYRGRLRTNDDSIGANRAYLSENRAGMDHAEKAATRESIDQATTAAEVTLESARRIERLLATPYFGRFDFAVCKDGGPRPVYVGVHSFFDPDRDEPLIFDWRAPIASMFYDFEPGPANYEAPVGRIHGELTLKRQFRIRRGHMEFMLDSGLNIQDDVLQEELSRTADDRMRNIVATIQRDQNSIIRDESTRALVIQGVAGSGKTSVALHRIAFLLYRFRDTLTSEDFLIVSPNKVFGDYISNVLPELGEARVPEVQMEELAEELLDYKVRFQSSLEQISLLVESSDQGLRERVQAKGGVDFLETMNRYMAHLEHTCLAPEDLCVGHYTVPAGFIAEAFKRTQGTPAGERVTKVVRSIEQKLWREHGKTVKSDEHKAMRAAIRGMYRAASLRKAYKGMFAWMGRPELFKPARGSRLEYSDVFPLIYLKLRLEGLKAYPRQPKHLLVDEMQDYSAVQYAVLERVFSCKKTILGDANQAVNPFASSTAEGIVQVVQGTRRVQLNKSYRSTYEITRFAQGISPSAELEAIERHGHPPVVVACADDAAELAYVEREAEAAAGLDGTLAVICKTQRQAQRLYQGLRGADRGWQLLDASQSSFGAGVVVCTAPLAKGLEFDRVLVPHTTEANYTTPLDRNLLYVACTRAMHRLTLTHTAAFTPLVGALDYVAKRA